MNDDTRNLLKTAAATAAALLLGSGCFSVNAGKPERFSKEYCAGEQTARTVSEKCVSAGPAVDARQLGKGRLGIGLKGSVETQTEKERVYKTLVVERQKKFDFGFCPGWREALDSRGLKRAGGDEEETDEISGYLFPTVGTSFEPDSKTYVNYEGGGYGWTFGSFLGIYLMIPYATFVEPFAGDWSCSTHHWILPRSAVGGGSLLQYFADETGERKIVLDLISTDPAFEPLKIRTHVNSGSDGQSAFASQFTHMAAFGFHKCSEIKILPPENVRREPVPGIETRTEAKTAVGPFRVRLEIPALGWSRTEDVKKGRAQAWFDLPAEAGEGTEARIRFEAPDEERAKTTELLLEAAGDTVYPHVL